MKKVLMLVALLIALSGVSKAQLLDLGLKLGYSSEDPQAVIDGVQGEINNFSNSTEFLKKCNAGLMLRLNLGNHLYIQPEANFALNSVWDSVDAQNDILGKLTTGFTQVKSVNLSVPVLLGIKLVDLDGLLALRVFGGPEIYTSINSFSSTGFNFETMSAVGGIGADVLNFIYLDARATYLKTAENPTIFYTFSLGLMLK